MATDEKTRLIGLLLAAVLLCWAGVTINDTRQQVETTTIELQRINREMEQERDQYNRSADRFRETVLQLNVETNELDKSVHNVKNSIDALDRSVDHMDDVQHEGKLR